MEEINSFGQTGQGSIHCLCIIGHIEGHQNLPEDMKTTKYEHMMPLIAAIEEAPEIKALLILINTVGGDVEAGLAIAELIAGMSKPTASLVLGGGHSIGVPLALAADKSFIAPSASMTIHPVRMNGPVIGVPQTFDYLSRIQASIDDFILSHSHINRDYLQGLLHETSQLANDVGSVLSGSEAVNAGLIDAVGTLSDALRYLHGKTDL
ncbi:MAG: ATP-dependent Clp protease proteolytic subunit [Oscillospiraceae bacterium]|nr:ATP-dependent Clp protease proteolytic subunit [Oscillospiraceae bacterium]